LINQQQATALSRNNDTCAQACAAIGAARRENAGGSQRIQLLTATAKRTVAIHMLVDHLIMGWRA
jgi:hypothetical protein